IGLRAFMRWQWANENNSVLAARAVDTATHPDFKGKGIFKRLTMQAVEECKKEGGDIVFNSPNKFVIHGYLKLVCQTAGHLPLIVKAGSWRPRFFSDKFRNDIYSEFSSIHEIKKLHEAWSLPVTGPFYNTELTKKYLEWRYGHCPVVKYGAIIKQ